MGKIPMHSNFDLKKNVYDWSVSRIIRNSHLVGARTTRSIRAAVTMTFTMK